MKPLMIDLCCGRGGWTKGFIAAGWKCIGYDIKDQPKYPGRFSRRNLMEITGRDLVRADFICCSTPCEQFSVHCLPFFKNPPFPVDGIRLFEHAREICEESGKPFIMENVRCAQKFVGIAAQHCGPFYFWGNAVPPIFPSHLYKIQKGLNIGGGVFLKGVAARMTLEQRRETRIKHRPTEWLNHKEREEATARIAEIPFEISNYVGQFAQNAMGVLA